MEQTYVKHAGTKFSPNCASNTTRPRNTNGCSQYDIPEAGNFRKENVSTAQLSNLTVIKRSNKPIQALNLLVMANINPRSVYSKVKEFHTFVEQEEVDLIFMSESWEREELTLQEIIKLDNHEVVSNVSQRKGKGLQSL